MWNERVEGSVEDVWVEVGKRSGRWGWGGGADEGEVGVGARGGGVRGGDIYIYIHTHIKTFFPS